MPSPARTAPASAALGLSLALAAGCTNNAGLTNGPPPVADEKPAVRTDLRTPEAPDAGTPPGAVGTAGGSDLGGTGSSGAAGARGGGREGAEADRPGRGKADEAAAANPPALDAPGPNGAGGATKPAGDIKVGTPKSPQ